MSRASPERADWIAWAMHFVFWGLCFGGGHLLLALANSRMDGQPLRIHAGLALGAALVGAGIGSLVGDEIVGLTSRFGPTRHPSSPLSRSLSIAAATAGLALVVWHGAGMLGWKPG